ncbi:MAG: mandelate racemase/muconate lactonizing enzyme family protein [Halobacteriaceae archaeon]
MEIADVEAIPVAHELGEGRALGSSRGQTGTRFTCLVRLETRDGTVGWGEAFAPPETTATLVDELLADDVVGRDPYETEEFLEGCYSGKYVGYHFGGHAFPMAAVSGIDVAMWDLVGKATGEPVSTLLGRRRDSVTPYASTGYVTSWGQDIAEPIEEAASEGFTAAKIKIGRGIEDDVHRVSTTREILGEDANLMVDFNGNYDPKLAAESAAALAAYDLTWIEEPVPSENYQGYRDLQGRVDVPLAAGEAHYGRFEFQRLAEDRLVDVLQPNIGRVGGFTEGRFVGNLATTENVSVCPHVWNSGVGVAAALQLAGSLPDYPHSANVPDPFLFEFDRSENPLRHELLADPFDPTCGELAVPDEPGIGVTVDEDAVEEYRID